MHRQPIALFVPSLHGGGAERVMLELASGLVDRGIRTDLVLVKAEGEYLSQVPNGLRIVDLNSHRAAASLLKLVRYVRQEQPVALLSTLTQASVIALAAKLMLRGNLRVVTRIANTYSEEFATGTFKHRQALRLLKAMFPVADGVVAVSQGVADDLKAVTPGISRKVTTIYNPVVRPQIAEQAQTPSEHPWLDYRIAPVVLSVGRLAAAKDHATLIKAFALVILARRAKLIILGDGPERESLIKLVEQLNLSEYVDLPGFKANPYTYMSKASVFALSSRYEGFPNVLVQAMACGTPVVSTDCRSGPREILEDGRWGRLVPVGDWRAMSKAIIQALDNPPPSGQISARASVFSADAAIDRYLEVLTGSRRSD